MVGEAALQARKKAVSACVTLANVVFMHEAAEAVRLPNENEQTGVHAEAVS